jgi:hypothetical protein
MARGVTCGMARHHRLPGCRQGGGPQTATWPAAVASQARRHARAPGRAQALGYAGGGAAMLCRKSMRPAK